MEQKRPRKPHIFYHNGFWRVSRAVQPWNNEWSLGWDKTTNMNLHVRANFFVVQLNDKQRRFNIPNDPR